MLQALYEQHAAAILRYLRRMFADPSAAEDVLQETFVRAADQLDRLAAVDCPRAWLFGVARHVGLTQRRTRPMAALPADAVARPAADADDDAVRRMRAAIERLPAEMRETLELRLRDELTYEEISVALRIPVGTVRSRLHNAVRRLRRELEVQP